MRLNWWRCVKRFNPAQAAPGPRDQCPVRTVGCEHAVVAGEVHPRPGNQRGQAHQKIQRLEHNLRGAVIEAASAEKEKDPCGSFSISWRLRA